MPRKSTKKNVPVFEPEYLGIPKDENEWLKYQGCCTIFTGINLNEPYTNDPTDYQFWDMQLDEYTKQDLIAALELKGVKCESVNIVSTDIYDGTKRCECVCYYNKPYQVYNSEFFLDNLSGFSFSSGSLEFYFSKRLD